MAWRIEYTRTASDQLRKLDRQVARRLLDYMDRKIAPLDNPRQYGKALRGPMGQLWRYRVGDCRVICDLRDEVLTVLVLRVGHRKEVYRL